MRRSSYILSSFARVVVLLISFNPERAFLLLPYILNFFLTFWMWTKCYQFLKKKIQFCFCLSYSEILTLLELKLAPMYVPKTTHEPQKFLVTSLLHLVLNKTNKTVEYMLYFFFLNINMGFCYCLM